VQSEELQGSLFNFSNIFPTINLFIIRKFKINNKKINNKYMTNSMSIKTSIPNLKVFAFLAITIVLGLFLSISNVQAAAFNNVSGDLETLTLENRTTNPAATNPGSANWRDPVSASGGDALSFRFYYHNTEFGTVANNVRLRIAYPTNALTSIVTTGSIVSDNATTVSNTGTINVSSAQTISFETTAMWYPNQTTTGGISIPVTNNGSYIEVNLGNINGGWAAQGNVVFRADISNNPVSNNPTVDAGANVTVNEGQSVGLSATATDPQGDAMTYSWSCNGGSLTSSTILNPTYNAPSVTVNTTYICTFTATDTGAHASSDTVSITVVNTTPAGPNDPVVDAGANATINEGQSVGLSATATDPQGDAMTYSWSCNGGSLTSSTILNPTYNAPSVTSTTIFACTFTARDTNGNTGSDTAYITVLNTDSSNSGSGGSGWGGPELNVTLSANPATGTSPLNGVDLIATVNSIGLSDYITIYSFDCENNNSWELKVESKSNAYTAVDLCNYYYDDTYTAKVKVERGGYTAYAQATIIPGQRTGSGYGISVDAGPNKDIGENQSTVLNGYGYSQYGYNLTSNWTCNGGSLSNANSLTPTYYAPTVTTDMTYTCVLHVTDSRGYKNSDTASIIVRNTGTSLSSGLAVSTNTPTNVASNSATLNGTVINDGGQYASVRFNWGKLSAYNNFTPWVNNKGTGQAFNYYIAGLEKGKAYHYRVEASNGREVVVGQDVAFLTKPDTTTGFVASNAGAQQISLSWNKGATSCYTMITRKAGSYPANSSDGTIVYYGTGSSVVDKNLNNNVWYYYRAWSVGCDEGLISYSESQNARAYTASGTTSYVAPSSEVVETGISVDTLARDITQNEIAWQNSITAIPNDEIEFKVIITPTGARSLEDVILKTVISDKISSIKDIKVSDESYNGKISEDMKLGTIALGESKIITFKGKIDSRENFSYGSNELISTTEISAKNNETVKKTVTIDAVRSVEAEAGLISLIDMRAYAGVLTFLFIILCIVVMYLLIERKKGKECLTEKVASTKVEKSKYFNIK
jgi:hypothetical protein